MNFLELDIDAFVLVGGASSRMGHPKAQLYIAGQRLFERAAMALNAVAAGRIKLIGNVGSDFDSSYVVIRDIQSDPFCQRHASITGIFSALKSAKTKWVAILACDLPFVTAELMASLVILCTDDCDAVVPIQPDMQPQPLCAFYRSDVCLPVIELMLMNSDLKLQNLLTSVHTRFVEFSTLSHLEGSEHFFFNVNDPDDYNTAKGIASQQLTQ